MCDTYNLLFKFGIITLSKNIIAGMHEHLSKLVKFEIFLMKCQFLKILMKNNNMKIAGYILFSDKIFSFEISKLIRILIAGNFIIHFWIAIRKIYNSKKCQTYFQFCINNTLKILLLAWKPRQFIKFEIFLMKCEFPESIGKS